MSRVGMHEIVPHTRRQRVANRGDTIDVLGPGKVTLFDASEERGDQRVLVVQCLSLFLPSGSSGDFRPYVHIAWGHGASSVATDVECVWRQRFPFVGSSLTVQAYVRSLPLPASPTVPGVPVPGGTIAKFRAFMSEGIDGLPLVPTRWISQLGVSSGVFIPGPSGSPAAPTSARIKTARVCAIPAAGEYFQLFDSFLAPIANQVPFDVVAVDTNGNGEIDLRNTRAFVNGIAWGMSSTPFKFTATGTDVAAFAEIQQ